MLLVITFMFFWILCFIDRKIKAFWIHRVWVSWGYNDNLFTISIIIISFYSIDKKIISLIVLIKLDRIFQTRLFYLSEKILSIKQLFLFILSLRSLLLCRWLKLLLIVCIISYYLSTFCMSSLFLRSMFIQNCKQLVNVKWFFNGLFYSQVVRIYMLIKLL